MGHFGSPTWTALAAVVTLMGLYVLYQKLLPKPIPGIPYNKAAASSLLGDMPSLARHAASTGEPMAWFRQQAEAHRSPLVQVFVRPFSKPYVLLSDYREVQAMMLHRSPRSFDRSRIFRDILGGAGVHHHILKKTTDPGWKAQRKLLADLMTPAFLHTVAAPHVYAAVRNIIDLWEAKARIADGRPFEVELDAYYLALDAVVAFSYGDSYSERALSPQIEKIAALSGQQIAKMRATSGGAEDAPMVFPEARVHEALEATLAMVQMTDTLQSSVVPRFTWWWLSKTPKIRKAWSARDEFVAGEIAKAAERLQDQGDDDGWMRCAVDLIVSRVRRQHHAEQRPGPVEYITDVIIEEVFGFVMAGHESSSSTLVWALKYLTNNQNVQQKLRATLHAAHATARAENRLPTADEVIHTQIPYLDAVMDEVLRLCTPIPFLARDAEEDVEILGARIPKGTTVFTHSHGPSMLSPPVIDANDQRRYQYQPHKGAKDTKAPVSWWATETMAEFRPERWLAEQRNPKTGEVETVYDPNAGPFLSFGLGQRGCFGRRLGLFEFRTSLTLLIWHFEFLAVPLDLAGYGAYDGLTRRPKNSYVRVRRVIY